MEVRVENLRKDLSRQLRYDENSPNMDFLISWLVDYNPYTSTTEIVDWLTKLNSLQYFDVKQIPIPELRDWAQDRNTGNIVHKSGQFFSIKGISINIDIGPVKKWCHPIIDQPEVGILGLIAKKIGGILYFLVQAKAESGNINTFQLSPSVQATYSNYTQVHGGKKVPYIEYFLDNSNSTILVDQLQSEQGGRFYKKRNRNMVVLLDKNEEITMQENYVWASVRQIKELLLLDNFVNMDLRSVISTICYHSETATEGKIFSYEELKESIFNHEIVSKSLTDEKLKLLYSSICAKTYFYTNDEVLTILRKARDKYKMGRRIIPLNEVSGWIQNDNSIYHQTGKHFSIIGVRTNANNREINSWDQPIMEQKNIGITGMVAKEIEGILHFLIHLKAECGLLNNIECGPTVQLSLSNYDKSSKIIKLFTALDENTISINTIQSEEGGRFYKYQNRNIIINNNVDGLDNSDFYFWISPYQLKTLMNQGSYVNVECRSILSFI